MSDATLSISADIAPYFAEVSKIPGVTADAALAAAVELKREQDKIVKQAAAAAEKIKANAEKSAGTMESKVAGAFQAINKTASVIAPSLQGVTGPLDDIGDLLEKVGTKGAVALVAVGALAAGVVALTANAADVAMRIDEVSEELGASSPLMIAYRDDLEDARDSIESAGFALADMRTELAGRWAGAVQDGASIGVSFAAIMGEIGSDVGVATSYIASSVGALIDQEGAVSGALSVWVDYGAELQTQARLQREIAEGEREIAAALSVTTRELELQSEALLQQQLAALGMVETGEQEAARLERDREAEWRADEAKRERERRSADAAKKIEKADADRRKAAEELYQKLQALHVAELSDLDRIIARRDIDIAKLMELGDASGNLLTAEEAIQARIRQAEQETADLREKLAKDNAAQKAAALTEMKSTADAVLAAMRAGQDALGDDLDATAEEQAAIIAEREAAAMEAYSNITSSVSQTASMIGGQLESELSATRRAKDEKIKLYEEQARAGDDLAAARTKTEIDALEAQEHAQRRAALVAFGINKAIALSDIAVSTAVASVAALEAGPVAGAILSALTIAAGAAAAATVAAQQPSFHTGLFSGSRSLAADETRAILKTGEVVIPRPMVDRAGGPDHVRQRVDGGGSGGTVLVADFASRRVVVPLLGMIGRSSSVDPMLGYSHGR